MNCPKLVPSWSCWKTPDNGQRNCPKYVEFHSINKFEKLMPLVGYVIRILKHGDEESKEWTVQHVSSFPFPSPPTPIIPEIVYTSLISIIFRSNGNIIPLFFIFIFFLSLQITPCCPFYLLRPSTPHPTITILYLFFYLFHFLPSVSFYHHNHHHFPWASGPNMTVSLSPCRKWPAIILRNSLQSSVFLSLSCIFLVPSIFFPRTATASFLLSRYKQRWQMAKENITGLLRTFEASPGSTLLAFFL